jgi:stage V sporulation protein G
MKVSVVTMRLVSSNGGALKAICDIVMEDAFRVNGLKVIQGGRGYFVAMPSRKLEERCQYCGGRNHFKSTFCNSCGSRLITDGAEYIDKGERTLHMDIAHPINNICRNQIQEAVLAAFRDEMAESCDAATSGDKCTAPNERDITQESSRATAGLTRVTGEGLF